MVKVSGLHLNETLSYIIMVNVLLKSENLMCADDPFSQIWSQILPTSHLAIQISGEICT